MSATIPEIMGLNLELLRPQEGASFTVNGQSATVISQGSRLGYEISWDDPNKKNKVMSAGDIWLLWSEVFRNTLSEQLTLPRFFMHMGEIENRRLSVSFGEGPQSLERFAQMIFGLQVFGSLQNPPINIRVRAKVWNDAPHGINPNSKFVWVDNAYDEIKHLNCHSHTPTELSAGRGLTAAFMGNIEVSVGGETEELFFPVADLEVPYGDTERLRVVGETLAAHGFSGSLIRSGEFTHFLGDYLLPRFALAQTVGTLMRILTPQSDAVTQTLASELYFATRDEEVVVGQKILDQFPSGGYTGSNLDLRWAAHIFVHNQGCAGLRCLSAKGNGFKPFEIGRVG